MIFCKYLFLGETRILNDSSSSGSAASVSNVNTRQKDDVHNNVILIIHIIVFILYNSRVDAVILLCQRFNG